MWKAPAFVSMQGVPHLLILLLLSCSAAVRPRFHLVTFMDKVQSNFAFLQVSAEAHALHPVILGYGTRVEYPDLLGPKINELRRYVWSNAQDQDIVLFVDAADVMIFGDKAEIVARFEELERATNRSIIFNAEGKCQYEMCNDLDNPQGRNQLGYLNSGVIVGRGLALKTMLLHQVPDRIVHSDQIWYHRYYRDHPDAIALDVHCHLLCATKATEPRRNRAYVPVMGTYPSVVHFPGSGHWLQRCSASDARGYCSPVWDLFRALYPAETEYLPDLPQKRTWRGELYPPGNQVFVMTKWEQVGLLLCAAALPLLVWRIALVAHSHRTPCCVKPVVRDV